MIVVSITDFLVWRNLHYACCHPPTLCLLSLDFDSGINAITHYLVMPICSADDIERFNLNEERRDTVELTLKVGRRTIRLFNTSDPKPRTATQELKGDRLAIDFKELAVGDDVRRGNARPQSL